VFEAYKRYADFQGRSGRSEFWLFVLFCMLVGVAFSILSTVLGGNSLQPNMLVMALYGIFSLVSLVPSLAVAFRRLHDTDRSAWWLLIGLVPLLGAIVLIVFYCLPGTPGPNRFGPPQGATAGDAPATA
jgi:uncharacterized membrane protein YhaH (DUF805 family)